MKIYYGTDYEHQMKVVVFNIPNSLANKAEQPNQSLCCVFLARDFAILSLFSAKS